MEMGIADVVIGTVILSVFYGVIYIWAVRGMQAIDFQSPELRKKYSKLKLPFFNYKKP